MIIRYSRLFHIILFISSRRSSNAKNFSRLNDALNIEASVCFSRSVQYYFVYHIRRGNISTPYGYIYSYMAGAIY